MCIRDSLKGKTAVKLMDHIQYKLLIFIAVWLLRLHLFPIFIQTGDLLFHYMKRKLLFPDEMCIRDRSYSLYLYQNQTKNLIVRARRYPLGSLHACSKYNI